MKKISKVIAFMIAISSFILLGTSAYAKEEEVIYQGVFIENVDVSGMNLEEANQAVEQYVQELNKIEITLKAVEDKTVTATAEELGITWSNPDILQEAMELGRSGNIIKRYKARKDLEKQNRIFHMSFDIKPEILNALITERCEQYNQEAQDATLVRANGSFTVKEGQTGLVIDTAASVEKISAYMAEEWNHEPVEIDLVVAKDEPTGKTEDLMKVKDILGSCTTSFKTSGSSRVKNVSNGTSLVDGITLYPGETFSMYEAVSPFTEANGYYMAGSYLNGMVVDSLGGGICQVSTTLYGAVLQAELEVTERFNHSMIVTYVEPSADAAIAGTYKDFKFVNNKEYPIYIEGYTTEDKKIYFNIYGAEDRPSNRTVKYVSEVLSTTPPEPERIIADAGQPVGFLDVQSSHTGYTAKLWKVVEEDGAEVSRTEVNKSTYKQSPRTATVGIATSDPGVMAGMQAAIATGSIDHVKNVVGAYKAAMAQAAAQPPQEQPPQEQPPQQQPDTQVPAQ